jgi:hypothetical protein
VEDRFVCDAILMYCFFNRWILKGLEKCKVTPICNRNILNSAIYQFGYDFFDTSDELLALLELSSPKSNSTDENFIDRLEDCHPDHGFLHWDFSLYGYLHTKFRWLPPLLDQIFVFRPLDLQVYQL